MQKKTLLLLMGVLVGSGLVVGGSLFLVKNPQSLANTPFIDKFSPKQPVNNWKPPNQNPDGSITYYYNLAKIENVAEKEFLRKKYLVVTLRPRISKGFFNKTFSIEFPTDLPSDNTDHPTPSLLKSKVGKQIGLNITYSSIKPQYTFLDIKSWEIAGGIFLD